MSKQAKKRPKPVSCWGVSDDSGRIVVDWCTADRHMAMQFAKSKDGDRVIRVRIVPVVAKAKRRKGAK